MELLLLIGLLLLFCWAKWAMYIAARQSPFSVSLLLKVDADDCSLDPLLRLILRCFAGPGQISLAEVWVVASDRAAGPALGHSGRVDEHARVLQILSERYPLLNLHLLNGDGSQAWHAANGLVILCLDLAKGLTPLAALQAVKEICAAGPMPPATMVLPTS